MKNKIIIITICLSLIIVSFCPIKIVEGKTLRDYKNELAELEKKQASNRQQSSAADAEVTAKQNAITAAERQMKANEEAVEAAKVKIAESEEQIKVKNAELQDVINIMQYTEINSSEMYIDYIINSESISEMMERQAIIDQIIDYTQGELDALAALIKENEQLQIDLAAQNENLTASVASYEKQVAELEALINKLYTIGLDYDDQIKAQKSLISQFEKAGCKDNDSVDECYFNKGIGSGEFLRPTNTGYVTQTWGTNGHYGIDIGVSPGTNVYAPADGVVYYVRDGVQYLRNNGKKSCGGHEIYIYFKVNGKTYTGEFAHLRAYYVSNGQTVRQGQVIALSGGDSSTFYYDRCTTGAHLHYALAYGYWGKDYSSWNTWLNKTTATTVQSIIGIKNQKGFKWTSRY